MLKATALAGAVLIGLSGVAIAADAPQRQAQSQTQNRSQMEQTYQQRLRDAKTPEERARIQAEHDRAMQQGAVPGNSGAVRTGPGTAGSGTLPSPDNNVSGSPSRAGESPTGGGGRPPGQ